MLEAALGQPTCNIHRHPFLESEVGYLVGLESEQGTLSDGGNPSSVHLAGRDRISLSDAVIESKNDRGGAIAQVELGKDVVDMRLDGDLADDKFVRDLSVSGASRHQLQDLQLSGRHISDALVVFCAR